MSEILTIHTTPAELATEQFWATRIDPVAQDLGLQRPTWLHNDPGNHHVHMLKDVRGAVVLIVRTDG